MAEITSVPTTSENQGALVTPLSQSGGSFSILGGPQAKDLKNCFFKKWECCNNKTCIFITKIYYIIKVWRIMFYKNIFTASYLHTNYFLLFLISLKCTTALSQTPSLLYSGCFEECIICILDSTEAGFCLFLEALCSLFWAEKPLSTVYSVLSRENPFTWHRCDGNGHKNLSTSNKSFSRFCLAWCGTHISAHLTENDLFFFVITQPATKLLQPLAIENTHFLIQYSFGCIFNTIQYFYFFIIFLLLLLLLLFYYYFIIFLLFFYYFFIILFYYLFFILYF